MNRSSSNRSRLLVVFLLLAVYVLSFGPVKALYAGHKIEGSIPTPVVTFYKPVSWLYANTPLGKPMAVHDDWWKRTLKRS